MEEQLKQSTAVINAVMQVKPDFEQNSDVGLDVIAGETRKAVCAIVTAGIVSGEIRCDKIDVTDEAAVKKYVPSMVSNWLRKSPKLNGGTAHKIKNPGSRAGSGDKALKNMRALAKVHKDNPETLAEIQKHIDERVATLKAEKVKHIELDMDAIPDSLKAVLEAQQD